MNCAARARAPLHHLRPRRLPARRPARLEAVRPPAAAPAAAERLLQRLEWTVIRRLDGSLQGSRTPLRGSGIKSGRPARIPAARRCAPHRLNVTARLATPHVRVFTEDRDMTARFLLDPEPPGWTPGAPGQAKRDLAEGFVACSRACSSATG